MKVDIAIPDLPKVVGNAASMGEPAALHGRFNKAIVALAARRRRRSRSTAHRKAPASPVRQGWRRIWPVRPMSGTSPSGSGAGRHRHLLATAVEAVESPPAPKLPPGAAIVELRSLCLGEMDPTSLAKLTPEELTQEVERTLAEIATERRIQLNGREQRALAGELVDDMLGLGPLEPLLEDDAITDIMVNGPERVFVERARQAGAVQRALPRRRRTSPTSASASPSRVGRRVDESSARWWTRA